MEPVARREWYTISEVRVILGIGSTKAYELVQTGDLPAIRIGRALRVHQRDIDAWAERIRYLDSRK
jgi:excisionase family DNA binding protein